MKTNPIGATRRPALDLALVHQAPVTFGRSLPILSDEGTLSILTQWPYRLRRASKAGMSVLCTQCRQAGTQVPVVETFRGGRAPKAGRQAPKVGRQLHYTLFDRISILFVEQAAYRPNTPYPGVFSTSACTMQDVVWSNQALADLCGLYSWDSRL